MNQKGFRPRLVWPMVILAFALWFVTFYLTWLNFWIKIAFSTAVLAALSVCAHTIRDNRLSFDRTAISQGLIAAVVLYLVFWVGKVVSSCIFPFASNQIGAIYGKGAGFSTSAVFFLLLFVTGPCEEIYWRGFLQRNLMSRYGEFTGWLLATMIYTGVHIWSFNFMLIGAAAVAGAFWGLLYMNKIAFSTAVLAALSVCAHTIRDNRLSFDRTAISQGLIAAVVLYLVFWVGKVVSSCIFPFASNQIGAIYGKGAGFSTSAVFFLLLFVTGPCEEIYWRGFLQRNLMSRYGEFTGWLLATMIYTGVHIWSFNFMLIGAAAVAGAFWGLLYMKLKRLDTLIICHSLWSACIFAVVPLM